MDKLEEEMARATCKAVFNDDPQWQTMANNAAQACAVIARKRVSELEAVIARIRAALAFEQPRDRDALDRALAADIVAGMSLRKAAEKHGTNLGIARRAVARAALHRKGVEPK